MSPTNLFAYELAAIAPLALAAIAAIPVWLAWQVARGWVQDGQPIEVEEVQELGGEAGEVDVKQ